MISYHCSECGAEAEQGVDAQGGEGALHCPAHPRAVIDSVVASDEIEVISVKPDSSDADEGPAYWVTARINGKRVRLFAAPPSDGRPGLAPCGDSLDDWCPVELRTAFGDDEANRLGREAILMARP